MIVFLLLLVTITKIAKINISFLEIQDNSLYNIFFLIIIAFYLANITRYLLFFISMVLFFIIKIKFFRFYFLLSFFILF